MRPATIAALTAKAKAARSLRAAERHELKLAPAEHSALFAICTTPTGRHLRHADLSALTSLLARPEIEALTADCEPVAPTSYGDAADASERQVTVIALPTSGPPCPTSTHMLAQADSNSREFGHVGRDGRPSNFGVLANGRCKRMTPRQYAKALEDRAIADAANAESEAAHAA